MPNANDHRHSTVPPHTHAASATGATVVTVTTPPSSDGAALVAAHASSADPHEGYQKESEKGEANGYASLDASALVPADELPVGTGSAEVAAGDHTHAGGDGAPTDVDYLVGTASDGLSAEIVVGTAPGGELGGTWASPTVDATHAGSTHLALGSTSSTAAAGDHSHGAGAGLVSPIVAVFDAGTAAITGNPEVDVVIPADGTLTGWTMIASPAGDAVVDAWKAAGAVPTNSDSITNGHEPALSSDDYATDSDLSDWASVTVTAGDVIRFHLDSSVTVHRVELTLTYARS